ncbi:DUF1656 domain-containing protein [Enterobacter mori]|uniref:DUF1656 domain-containing protein n=1 Tax=Enterobacter mori TaxID=539813 RepID=UPI0032AEADCB
MVNDLNIGGVFIPGLLTVALAALVCTLSLVALFSLSRLYRHLPAADEHTRQFVFRLVDLHCALREPEHG